MSTISRRSLLSGLGVVAVSGSLPVTAATSLLRVSKDPNCGCCSAWIEHVQAAGFITEVHDLTDLSTLKTRLSIPAALHSCHTAQIEGYVIEGHVPASAIRRLLKKRPLAIGLAVPGMPIGSPGMEVSGAPAETYDVILFERYAQKIYSRYKGGEEISSRL
jgi:hypothetical protein